ncbi:Nardilysin [Cyphomyrmex costatus]|uniref:Nardilysin n=1 Tax=Cyphomyrmex costatus TaxID=456900 RepID=A0A195CEX7_9HYME|nr:Nardilysin [Cyphomyrmex costatus]
MEEEKRTTGDDKCYVVEYLETPVKLKDDKKEYRAIRLPNGLEALLICDSETCSSQDQNKKDKKKAACGLCVGVGSFSDPPEVPAIAQYFESMLFTGFDKYPPKYDLDKFIYNHGGMCDCLIDFEHTTFFFDIQEENFFSALVRFAKFFSDPSPETHEYARQLKAIKNEFQVALFCTKNIRELLFSSFARTGHPANKFTGDDLKQLICNVNYNKVCKELYKFKKRHYSAHRMKLVLQSRLPLDTLERYVITYFRDVPTNRLPPDDFTKFKNIIPFDTPIFRKIYKVEATKFFRRVQITWAMPSLLVHKTKPYEYISRIIEQEGRGSLISYLRKKMWICTFSKCALYCKSQHNSMYSLVQLVVELSHEGFQHMNKILDAIFSFINLLKREGARENIFDEFCEIEKNSFRFINERENRVNYVKNLCKSMHFYSSCNYIAGNNSFIHFKYDPEAIQKCLNYLVPETANFMIFDKDFDCFEISNVEPLFEIKYIDNEIPKKWIEHWKIIEPLPDFHLSLPNIFLPSDFSLIPIPEKVPEYPVKLHNDDISEIWYRLNPKSRLPNSYMNIYFISSLGFQSPNNAALMTLYYKILKLLLLEELYSATQAGYNYKINVSKKGIIIKMSGFNEKLSLLLETIVKCMVDCPNRVTEDTFKMIKTEQLSIYYNTFTKSKEFAEDIRLWILKHVHYTHVDMHNALININFEDLQQFVKSFTNNLYIQCLVEGNMMQNAVIETIKQCVKLINCSPLQYDIIKKSTAAQIPLGTSYCKIKNINKSDANSVVMKYYQADYMSIELSMIINLIIMIMKKQLLKWQSQEKLRHVLCDFKNVDGIAGYCITVYNIQKNKYTTEHVDQQIDKFLKSFKYFLENLSEEELNNIKDTWSKSKQHTDINIEEEEEVNRNWDEITTCQYMFDRFQKEKLALEEIKMNKLREWFAKNTNESNFRTLSIHIVGIDPKNRQYLTLDCLDTTDDQQYKQINHIIKVDDYKKKFNTYPVIEG